MLKAPTALRVYCRRCNKHTEHTVKKPSKGKPRNMSWGQRQLERKRRGYGGEPRGRLRRKAKTTKKGVLLLVCKVCGMKKTRVVGRVTRLEFKE